MGKIAFVFAGQGAQYPGMGQELAQCSPAAAQVFQQLDALRPGTSQQCFSGTEAELKETRNTQPCIGNHFRIIVTITKCCSLLICQIQLLKNIFHACLFATIDMGNFHQGFLG